MAGGIRAVISEPNSSGSEIPPKTVLPSNIAPEATAPAASPATKPYLKRVLPLKPPFLLSPVLLTGGVSPNVSSLLVLSCVSICYLPALHSGQYVLLLLYSLLCYTATCRKIYKTFVGVSC